MNPAVILALIGDLYSQIGALTEQTRDLRADNARLTTERDDLLHRADHAPGADG